MDNRSREAVVKAFFQTHQADLVYTPGPSQEHITEKFDQLLPSLLESEIVFKIFKLPDLVQHQKSADALVNYLFNNRCKQCNDFRVIYEAGVFTKDLIYFFLEDGTQSQYPNNKLMPIEEGFHFGFNNYCKRCDMDQYVICSYEGSLLPLLHTLVKEVFHEAFPKQAIGYIVKSSWIDTFFVAKQYDHTFSQKTLQHCVQTFYTMLRAGKIRHLSQETMDQELSSAVYEEVRNLIPQVQNELEFCGLIKGVWRFNSLCILYILGELPILRPTKKKLNLEKLLRQHLKKTQLLPSETRKNLLAQAIITVGMAYQELTTSALPMPKWLQEYYEQHYQK